jgi:hypothetical protein
METAITKTRGKMAVVGFKGEIIEIDYNIAIPRK